MSSSTPYKTYLVKLRITLVTSLKVPLASDSPSGKSLSPRGAKARSVKREAHVARRHIC